MKTKRYDKRLVTCLLVTAVIFGGVSFASAAEDQAQEEVEAPKDEWIITKNPYDGVVWEDYGQYLGSLHNHTTESDGGNDPAHVIDEYHEAGFKILAISDHNHVTWPWQDYGRDPEELGMVAIVANELSRHHHTNSHFTRYPRPFREASTGDLETSLAEHEELGGFSHLNHPGRYWDPNDDGEVDDHVLQRYADLFKEYPSLLGMEIHNQDDRFPEDRLLWDALLTEFMPRRGIWGFANDDSHNSGHVGLNAIVFLLPELDKDRARLALARGQFYATTIATHPHEERDLDKAPVIQIINYDAEAGTLTIEAESGGEPVPSDAYTWISGGGKTVQDSGTVLDLNETEGLDRYLRVEIRGAGGTAYTQPFGVRIRPE
ncbi:MAG: hypothetical protein WD490_01100 [Opitutales bacterium]